MSEPRMLVATLAHLESLMTATPAIRVLRRSFPKVQLDALVTPHTVSLLQGSPLVDEVFALPKARYDGMPGALNVLGAIERLGVL